MQARVILPSLSPPPSLFSPLRIKRKRAEEAHGRERERPIIRTRHLKSMEAQKSVSTDYSSASPHLPPLFPPHFPLSSTMDGDLYDEFGNYIGPELDSDSEAEMPAQEHMNLGTAAMVRYEPKTMRFLLSQQSLVFVVVERLLRMVNTGGGILAVKEISKRKEQWERGRKEKKGKEKESAHVSPFLSLFDRYV
jgi:hypothetical protein